MVEAVRQLSDEDNTTDISDSDIIASLNRGQQRLVRIASRKYEPMFMRETTLSSFDGTNSNEATIPETAFSLIIDQVDVVLNNRSYRVTQAPIRQMSELETGSSTTSIPWYYSIRGNKILIYPYPSSNTSLRVRYQIRPPKLVKSQGRITTIDSGNTQVYIDSVGSDLTTSIAALKAFVNLVDGTTGLVKATMQISNIDTDSNIISFKTSSLDRSTVFNQTVSTSLPSDLGLDDYLTIADGTCIPQLVRDYSDFIIQHSVVETLNRLGLPSNEAYARLKELEDDVMKMWSGRPRSRRVTNKSRQWTKFRRQKTTTR